MIIFNWLKEGANGSFSITQTSLISSGSLRCSYLWILSEGFLDCLRDREFFEALTEVNSLLPIRNVYICPAGEPWDILEKFNDPKGIPIHLLRASTKGYAPHRLLLEPTRTGGTLGFPHQLWSTPGSSPSHTTAAGGGWTPATGAFISPNSQLRETAQLSANGNDSKWYKKMKCQVSSFTKMSCCPKFKMHWYAWFVCGVTKKKLYLNRWKPMKGLTGNSLITKGEFFFLFNKMDSVHEAI